MFCRVSFLVRTQEVALFVSSPCAFASKSDFFSCILSHSKQIDFDFLFEHYSLTEKRFEALLYAAVHKLFAPEWFSRVIKSNLIG